MRRASGLRGALCGTSCERDGRCAHRCTALNVHAGTGRTDRGHNFSLCVVRHNRRHKAARPGFSDLIPTQTKQRAQSCCPASPASARAPREFGPPPAAARRPET
eukprot:3359488-Prymnesium_polylepis.2